MDFEDGSDSKPKNAFLLSPSKMIVLTAFLFLLVSPSDEICDVTCTKGQFCFKERCSPCPNGYFQDTPIHQYTECKRWTFKPSFFNFVVKTPGTMTQDVEWTCKEGYELYRYTPGEYECRKLVPVTPDLVRTTTTENSTTNITTTEYELLTSEPPYTQPSENSLSLTKEVVTPLLIAVCSLIAISIIIMFILALLYKHRSYKRRLNHNIKSPMYKASTKQVSPPHYNFSYFSSIVCCLGEDSEKFIHHLHDPSGTFIASSAIYFQKAECGNVETAFTKVCFDWVNRNKGNNHIERYIFKALRDIGRNDVIEETNLETGGTSTCSTPLITHNNGNKFQFPFFYRLVEALGVDDSKKLLYRLPNKNNTFNAHSSLEFRMADGTSKDTCLVETFVDWKRKNPQMENWPHCLFDILTELGRNDVKETFQDILSSQDHHC